MRGAAAWLLPALAPLAACSTIPRWQWNATSAEAAARSWVPIVFEGSPAVSWPAMGRWDGVALAAAVGEDVALDFAFARSPSLLRATDGDDGYALEGHSFGTRYRDSAVEGLCTDERFPAFVSSCTLPAQGRAWATLGDVRGGALGAVAFTKLHPSNFADEQLAALRPLGAFGAEGTHGSGSGGEGGGGAAADLDVWWGTKGWRTATHYDFQANYYAVLHGEKHVVVGHPSLARDAFPHAHPRYRQLREDLLPPAAGDGSEGGRIQEATLREGDVLYIPPLYLHTFTTLSAEATAVAVCSAWPAEAAERDLERIALAFDDAAPPAADAVPELRLFLEAAEAACDCGRGLIDEVFRLRYAHLACDAAAPCGAAAARDRLRRVDPQGARAVVESRGAAVRGARAAALAARAEEVGRRLRRIDQEAARRVLLANYAETVVAFLLGEALLMHFFAFAGEGGAAGDDGSGAGSEGGEEL